jgi:hypothetical protein
MSKLLPKKATRLLPTGFSNRKVQLSALAVFVVAVAGAMTYASMRSGASAATAICLRSSGACLNGNAAPVRLTSSPWLYNPRSVGTVSGTWPFRLGSGYNTHYKGHAVWVFYQQNLSSCLGVNSLDNTDTWSNCAGTNKRTMWVPSGGWLLNVGATNDSGQTYPTSAHILTANCGGFDCATSVDNGGVVSSSLQNWNY